jgi:hypothetical protein
MLHGVDVWSFLAGCVSAGVERISLSHVVEDRRPLPVTRAHDCGISLDCRFAKATVPTRISRISNFRTAGRVPILKSTQRHPCVIEHRLRTAVR